MALTWAAIASGVVTSQARIRFRQLEKDFVRNLERLDGLDLTPDFNARLAVIKDLWPRYLEAMSLEAAEGGDRIFALSEQMLEVADSLTLFATRLSGIPEAHYVNVAGRNRMLSQRIAKFFLFREWPKLQETIAGLSPQVCAEFESNLSELVQAADRQPELVARAGGGGQAVAEVHSRPVPRSGARRQDQACTPGSCRGRAPVALCRYLGQAVRALVEVAAQVAASSPRS